MNYYFLAHDTCSQKAVDAIQDRQVLYANNVLLLMQAQMLPHLMLE